MKKRTINRLLSFVLSATLISGDILPAFAAGDDAPEPEISIVSADEAEEADESDTDVLQIEDADDVTADDDRPDVDAEDDEFVFVPGYVEVPGEHTVSVVADGIGYREIESGLIDSDEEPEYPDDLAKAQDSAFPYAYTETSSIRDYFSSKYPAARNQNPYGSCWAHSAMGLAEFYMINHGMADTSVDYSELHLVNYTYVQGTPSIAGYTGDTVEYDPANDSSSEGDDRNILNAGGNLEWAAQTLMRQRGVCLESDVPYSDCKTVIANGIDPSLERKDAVYLKNAKKISFENPELIKECIVNNGIVGVSIFADNSFYNSAYNSFYCGTITSTNHAVALVGWDDDFPKSNFRNTPEGNGAWLVRNSWNYPNTDMMSYYEYFWISYYDTSLTQPNGNNEKAAWTYEMMPASEYPGNSYYYDSQIHMNSTWGCPYAANIYKVSGGADYEQIEAVNFAASKIQSTGTGYEVRIYTGVDPSKGPSSGNLCSNATTTGTINLDGQYTVKLKAPVTVEKGEYFSVVVKRNDSTTVCFEYATPYTVNNGVSFSAGCQSGQSFISSTGISWTDVYGRTGNAVIGVLTSDLSEAPIDQSKITVTPASVSMNAKGQTQQLSVKVYDKNGNLDNNASVSYSSSNTSVATVSATGLVTAKGNGSANITITSGSLSATCKITVSIVTPKTADPVADPSSGTLYIGDSIAVSCETAGAEIYYTTNGTAPSKSSSKANGSIVIPGGTAMGTFTLKLIAYADEYDPSSVVTYTYTIASKAGVVLDKDKLTLTSGDYSATLNATVYGDDGSEITDAEVTWSSSNKGVATVDTKGTVSAVADGNTTITAKYGSKTASCAVTVSLSNAATPISDKANNSKLSIGDLITLSSTTPNAAIYYTINGSNPTSSSTKYSGSIKVDAKYAGESITLKAIAYADHYKASAVASYTYTVEESKAGISLTADTISLNSTKLSASLTAKVYKDDGSEDTSATVSWVTANSSIVSVDKTAGRTVKLTAVSGGSTTITAKSGNYEKTCAVTVKFSKAATPVADKTADTLNVGDQISVSCVTGGAKIYYTTDGSDPTDRSVLYSGSIKVTTDMLAKDNVTLKFRAYAANYEASDILTYKFKVADRSKIELSETKISFTEAGEEKTLTAKVYDAAGDEDSNASVSWSSSDTKVATVNNGTVKAVASGNAVIKAVSGTLTAECEVTVILVEQRDPSVSTNIIVVPDTISFNAAGKTQQLKVTVEDQYGLVISDPDLKFESSDTKVATVTKSGLVTSVSSGNAVITVSSGSISTGCKVSVSLPKAATPVAEQSEDTILKIGSYITVKCSTQGAVIRYTTDGSDPVESSAVAKGKIAVTEDMAGKSITIKLRAFASGYELSDVAEYRYTVEDRSAIELSQSKISFTEEGEEKTLSATVYDAAGKVNKDAVISWSSSDTKVATVNNGTVKAVASGNAVIKAVSGTLTAECEVTVVIIENRDPSVASKIKVSPDEIVLSGKGKTCQLKVTVEDQYGLVMEEPELSFSSSNTAAATVDNSGLVKAVAAGVSVITVKSGEVSAQCSVIVETDDDPYEDIEESHTVVFKVNGAVYYTGDVIKGHTLDVIPDDPEGNFLCWIDEETDAVWNTSAPIYRDMVLNARFEGEENRSGYESVPDLTKEDLYLVKGQKVQLDSNIKWYSDDKSCVTVSKKGVLTAKDEGIVTCVYSEDMSVVYYVYVCKPYFLEKNISLMAGSEGILDLDLGAYPEQYPVAWSSSAPAIASVTGGRVYGISKGSAKINATVNGKTYSCTVKVYDTEKTKVDKSTINITLSPMQSVSAKAKGEWTADEGMENVGTDKKPVYANAVVSVTKSGKITAIGSGSTTLHAPDGRDIVVSVSAPVEQVQYISAGKSKTLKFKSVKSAAATWESGNASVASVNQKGVVVANAVGYTTISCTYRAYDIEGAGFTYLTRVYVENPDLSEMSGIVKEKNKYSLVMSAGDSMPVKYTHNDMYAIYQPLTYKSNKPAVAYVDENGVIHGVSAGKAKLTAKINGKTLTISVEVR